MAKDAEVDNSHGDYKDEKVKKSLFKNWNRAMSYLTPNARQAFT